MNILLAAAIAYVLGAIPFGYLLVKWTTGGDVRTGGSGNIGATNVLRTTGRAAGIATLLLDIGKGYLAVWIAGRLTDHGVPAMCVAALAVMAGHAFPVFLRFKGGKAVASFVGAFLCLTPLALLAVLVVFVVVVAWTHYISMGSVVSATTFPLAVWLMDKDVVILATAVVAGAFIIYKHSSNIARVHAGNENRFTFGRKP
ncbi:MAG TPA: glycerol-3-phosphate 1-O-acyltransferase PlsY [Bryobacteraceae bacterium]|jgi:glycerol-3-phosphate acyltransferase PlsY|nr:glycerol-3-phosphate 1-O-acyltransferase PlsY [Bryobacteraceae bacterium]